MGGKVATDDSTDIEVAADVTSKEFPPARNSKQGGTKATVFVYLMGGLDNIGFVANTTCMVLYFLYVMSFDLSGSATMTTNYLGAAFMLTLVGAFISDAYMNRLNTILVFGGVQLLGYLLIIIQSRYKKLQPEPCDEPTCVKGAEAVMLYASLGLLAIGAGGIKGSLPALGADQFDQKIPAERKNLARFFNWFVLSTTIGSCIGVTVVVWVSTERGWYKGFLISMACAFTGLVFISSGRSLYRVRIPGDSPLLSIVQVLVVMLKNRKEHLPENKSELYEIHDHESERELIQHTEQYSLIDKAAVLPNGVKAGKWRVCTVTQVEEVKILTRMMPILVSTIFLNTCMAQLQTFTVQQGTLMNTKLGSFEVPSSSIPVIPLILMSVAIPIYEFSFVPLLRKITGHPNGITYLQRAGVGLVLSIISMSIAGFMEVRRKHELLDHNNRISLFWLAIQYAVFGVADMFTLAGLMDFFYSEAPAGMRSISTSFTWLSMSIGYFLSSIFVELTNLITSKITESKRGWLEGRDLNENHVELFYWLLAVLSAINFAIYLYCARSYSYKKEVPVMNTEMSLNPSSGRREDIATNEAKF